MKTISYQHNLEGIDSSMLTGFFVGWPKQPSSDTLYKLLAESAYIVLALHEEKVIGFINAISDKTLSAYIPLLEVLPEFQKLGIGKELIEQMAQQLKHIYMVDLCCDDELVSYYKNQGFVKSNGMLRRNYKAIERLTE